MKSILSKFLPHKKATIITLATASVVIITSILVAMPLAIFGEPVDIVQTSSTSPLRDLRNINTDALQISSTLEAGGDEIVAFADLISNNYNYEGETANNPIIITTLAQLRGLAYHVNNNVNNNNGFAGVYFALGNNIDLEGGVVTHQKVNIDETTADYIVSGEVENVWVPIGNHENKFRGNFDGAQFSINNMTSIVLSEDGDANVTVSFTSLVQFNEFQSAITDAGGIDNLLYNARNNSAEFPNSVLATIPTSEAHAGLFGYVEGGTIQNIVMNNPTIIAQQYAWFNIERNWAGAPVGITSMPYGFAQAGSVVGKTTGEITNARANNATIISGGNNSFAGGIAGSVNSSDDTTLSQLHVGGNEQNNVIVAARNSNVRGPGELWSSQAGGIVGGLGAPTGEVELIITNSSFNNGEVLSSRLAGGIAGAFHGGASTSSINFANLNINSGYIWASGTLTAQNNVIAGGIIGVVEADEVSFNNINFNSGSVRGLSTTGGLAGAARGRSSLTVDGSHVTANNLGAGGYQVGGFFGFARLPITIENSSFTGDIADSVRAGGIIGSALRIWGDGSGLSVEMDGVEVIGRIQANNQAGGLLGSGDLSGGGIELRNITRTGDTVADNQAGGFAGSFYVGGDLTITDSVFDGIVASNNSGGIISSFGSTGGITLTNVTQTGDITSTSGGAGGFAGTFAMNGDISITNSSFSGNITSTNSSAGGFSGGSGGLIPNITLNGFNRAGNTSAPSGHAGGFKGGSVLMGSLEITNSSFNGDVSGSVETGGIIGGVGGGMTSITLTNVTQTGDITSNSTAGGFAGATVIGFGKPFTITNSSFNGHVMARSHGGGIIGSFDSAAITLNRVTRSGNITVTNINSNPTGLAGGFAGAFATVNDFTITDSYFLDETITASIRGGVVGAFGSAHDITLNRVVQAANASGSIGSDTGSGFVHAFGRADSLTITDSQFIGDRDRGGIIDSFGDITPGDITLTRVRQEGAVVGGGFVRSYGGGDLIITNSQFIGNVGGYFAGGGIVGAVADPNITLTQVTQRGNVEAQAFAGGFVGVGAPQSITIIDSSATGNLTGNGGDAGGVIGAVGNPTVTLTRFIHSGPTVSGQRTRATVSGGSSAGGFIGSAGTLPNFSVINSYSISNVESNSFAGGVIGTIGGGDQTIKGLRREGNVTVAETGSAAGGYANTNVWNHLDIANSQFIGNVTGPSAGGIVESVGGGSITLNNIDRIGNVTATRRSVGQIFGEGVTTLNVTNSRFGGDVKVTDGNGSTAGGLIGILGGGSVNLDRVTHNGSIDAGESTVRYMGGLIGIVAGTNVDITNSSSNGNIILNDTESFRGAGGIIGAIYGGTLAPLTNITRTGNMIASDGVHSTLNSGGVFGIAHVGNLEANRVNVTSRIVGGWTAGGFAGNIGADSVSLNNIRVNGNISQSYDGIRTYENMQFINNGFGSMTRHGHAGGIIGDIAGSLPWMPLSEFSMNNVVYRGNVDGAQAGGLVGRTINIDLHRGASVGNITSRRHSVGGLIGSAVMADISESLAMGNIIANTGQTQFVYAGGLIGGDSVLLNNNPIAQIPELGGMDYHITNSFFAGNVLATSQEMTFAGGLVGGITSSFPGTSGFNVASITINNAYVVGNTSTLGATTFEGSIIGYVINSPMLSDVYVDHQAMNEARLAVGNWSNAVEPESGIAMFSALSTPTELDITNSYHDGVTNLRTIEMTGDGGGIPGRYYLRARVRDQRVRLHEDRADENVEFIASANGVWMDLADAFDPPTGDYLGTANIFYPRLAWLNVGPVYAGPALPPRGGEPGDNCPYPNPSDPPPFIYRASSAGRHNGYESITLHFELPGEPFENLLLEYREVGSDRFTHGAIVNYPWSRSGEFTINQLVPGTIYEFRLTAINRCGAGTPSNLFPVQVGLPRVPGVPNTGW